VKHTKANEIQEITRLDSFLEFWRLYQKNLAAVMGLAILIIFGFLAIFAQYIMPYSPFAVRFLTEPGSPHGTFKPPSISHLMGTDYLGRDVFSRFVWGARNAFLIGLLTAGLSTLLGLIIGALSGYYGNMIDGVLMRLTDIFMVLPTFFTIVLVMTLWGRNQLVIITIIAITIWPSTARLVRAEVLSVKQQDFIVAARVSGASTWHIIIYELFPNVAFVAIVNASMQTAFAITIEASLAFLGLGDPSYLSWGGQLGYGVVGVRSAWWVSTFPGLGFKREISWEKIDMELSCSRTSRTSFEFALRNGVFVNK
jgi:peptide/nickel transport system permease protein